MRFTIISPIHNEEKMLPYTLLSLYTIHPDEIIFGLDRCTDHSEEIIERVAERHRDTTTRLIHFNNDCDYKFRPAYLRRSLYAAAENDVIINTSADLRLDPAILNYLNLSRYKLISFGYLDQPHNYQSFAKIVLSYITIHGFAGLLTFSKDAWLETEDIDNLKTVPRAEDTHLHMAIASKYPTKHVNTRSLHLRPNESQLDHWNRGVSQWIVMRKKPIPAFLHSLIMLRPTTFAGYIYARRGESR